MGMFTDFMKKIFVHSPVAENPNAPTTSAKAGGPVHGAPPTPQLNVPGAGTPGAPTGTPGAQVDVAAILDKLASESKEKLDWKHSIVDMMKLVHMDSSLASRKELAKELNYSGDTNDSAAMNVWLHKEVIKKLAANGGHVPADLLD